MFKKNMGTIDRGIRVTAGIALVAAAASGALGAWAYIGVVPILTGLMANCPAYSLLGITTCRK
jgi:hypothetical protein